MPLFFQLNINASTKLAVWHIVEDENFFFEKVSIQRKITHPHKRLQHLAGRYLLKYVFPDFPSELIEIAETHKPFLADEAFHFSISHSGDYAAVIVSRDKRVGIDVEMVSDKVERVKHKFLNAFELLALGDAYTSGNIPLTVLWAAKESVFKWYGAGEIDFRECIKIPDPVASPSGKLSCIFLKESEIRVKIFFKIFASSICLAWVVTEK